MIDQLARDQFEVAAAFWVKRTDDGVWSLWIASPSVEAGNSGAAMHTIYTALDAIPGCEITPVDVTAVPATHPVALEAITERDRNPRAGLLRHYKKSLGGLAIVGAYIYPRPLPLDIREVDGRWEVLIADPDVWLTCDTQDEARAIAAARVLKHEAEAGLRTGRQFADELERTADVLEKYRMDFGSRLLRRRAQAVR